MFSLWLVLAVRDSTPGPIKRLRNRHPYGRGASVSTDLPKGAATTASQRDIDWHTPPGASLVPGGATFRTRAPNALAMFLALPQPAGSPPGLPKNPDTLLVQRVDLPFRVNRVARVAPHRCPRDLMWLGRKHPALRSDGWNVLYVRDQNRVIAFQRWAPPA